MTEAITVALELLNNGWTFIQGNPILFGVCALGLLTGAIHTVKSFF